MKRRIISFCVTCFIFFVAFMIVYPVWYRMDYTSHTGFCQSNLKQIALGIYMYSQDNDGKLPPAIFPGKNVGWAMELQPYLKSYEIFQCPLEKWNDDHASMTVEIRNFFRSISGASHEETPQPYRPGFTDYWLNSNLVGVTEGEADFADKSGKINYPEQIIMLGDGDGQSPQSTASYSLNQLPPIWKTSSDSPAKRHLGGANYAFLDGHTKWLKPGQVSQLPPSKKHPVYTFSIK